MSGCVEDPKVRGSRRACCDEDHFISVGRERTLVVKSRVIGQTIKTSPIGVNAIEISWACALRSKYDPLASRRPRGIVIERARRRERSLSGTIRIGDEQVGLLRGEDR